MGVKDKMRENEDEKEGWHTRDGVSLMTMALVTIGDGKWCWR